MYPVRDRGGGDSLSFSSYHMNRFCNARIAEVRQSCVRNVYIVLCDGVWVVDFPACLRALG